MIQTYLLSLVGGVMIGASAILFLVMTGRIAGISGIVGRLAQGASTAINGAFVVGLMLGPILFLTLFGAWPKVTMTASLPLAVLAGLLVGFGSRMGSGCTSGHGVLGLARLSPRSFVAVVTFLFTGIITVTVMRGSL
ncbi:YeeE/YedE family protein [Agrobacterium vitis]|uniref:YeeE/YedE family protein n=1 Tax=Agrobacterium vitis TaxID=373 RepID=A0A368NU11_AGRVI|nr:YeeE/YedE thiosulfate transporter family protein [Agrobacterium vitis]KAA3519489.1 YeeE/YedE family protein [Agrobacterium vitis]KAA3532300.1 YeeE/YedE family protein [Agrobacterium vitis]MCF1475617.1 YeeE/YedE family protein [Agrobacterium vitis]MUZ95149.1 YeeE/YedE family protein [Agrobacterium vitis]MVA29617.1 YeeE/YedE family protein [Agrobacterium vitis]